MNIENDGWLDSPERAELLERLKQEFDEAEQRARDAAIRDHEREQSRFVSRKVQAQERPTTISSSTLSLRSLASLLRIKR